MENFLNRIAPKPNGMSLLDRLNTNPYTPIDGASITRVDELGNGYDDFGQMIAPKYQQEPGTWGQGALDVATAPAKLATGLVGSLSPYGDEGWQVPPIISEPAAAFARLGEMTGFGSDGKFYLPNVQNPEVAGDVLTQLMTVYGGNALGSAFRPKPAGSPMSVKAYHGTGETFDKFSTPEVYGGTPEHANVFAMLEGSQKPNVIPLEMNFQNAIRSSDYKMPDDWTDGYASYARSLGADGVDFGDGIFAALKPNTVRSATTGEVLFSDNRPSLFGSALASQAEKKIGPGPEPGAVLPKAEAMGASDVLAENLSKAAEDAYVKAYRADLEANKYRYFNDWTEDPNAPLVVDDWGRQIGGGSEISELFDNATPYGYRALMETHPAVAEGLNAAAAAVGRDLTLVPSANSGSLYGTLRTPSGAQYKVRVADHGNISSRFDAPDYNIAPGEMTPEEFARLMPMLLSDNRPSLLGSALASQGDETDLISLLGYR